MTLALPASMHALVKARAEPGIWMQEVPIPETGPNDLLIKVKKAAICGTDLHIYNWDHWAQETIPVPLVVGHEFMGEVVAVGSHVDGFSAGDRVSGEGHITCGHCRNCRAGKRHLCRNTKGIGVNHPGCFADYLVLPAGNAFKLPTAIPDEIASFLDPLGNALHTALSFDLVGEDVLITGAGPIGCMAVAIAQHAGARNVVITDVNEHRLELARKMGATRVIHPGHVDLKEVMEDLGMTEGFDVGMEMSGHPDAFTQMLEVMNHGGHLALLGIPEDPVAIDWNQVIFKGLVLKGIYGREMYETWYKMSSLLQSGLNVAPVLTHRFKRDQFEEGFQVMKSGKCGKVVLDWED
jgi:threonine 3-dehydrogenase